MVVDASSLLFRSYHGGESRRAPDGRDTRVLYGTVKMMMDFAKYLAPHHAVVVFDASGGSFERKALYPDYKAHRPDRPEEIVKQEPLIRKFLKAGGVPVLSVVGVESDDTMATIAVKGSESGHHVGIVSPDKDMTQMVRRRISVFKPEKDENGRRILTRLDKDGVSKRFGVPPELIVDYLSLLGDTSDNIPGVDKVGPKTAVEWLTKYGSLDGIVAHANELSGVAGANLRSMIGMLPMVKELVRLRDDVVLPEWEEFQESDEDLLREMRAEFGLPGWMGSLKDWCKKIG